MNESLRTSEAGLDLIKSFEGLFLKAYYCPAGVLTIGYGHTNLDGTPPRVLTGMRITKEEAEAILRRTLVKYENAVKRRVRVPLTQHQFDALVSFTFNCGEGALAKSTLLRKLNAGNYNAVPRELMKWTRGGGKVLKGLVRRRKAEGDLWLTHSTDVFNTAALPYFSAERAPSHEGNALPQIIEEDQDGLSKAVKTAVMASPAITAASGFFGSFSDWKMLAVVCTAIAVGVAGYILYKEWKD